MSSPKLHEALQAAFRVFTDLDDRLTWDEFTYRTERLHEDWPELHDALQELVCVMAEEEPEDATS